MPSGRDSALAWIGLNQPNQSTTRIARRDLPSDSLSAVFDAFQNLPDGESAFLGRGPL